MEGSAYTQRTVEMVRRVRAKYPGIGTVMQSYLYRTEKDVETLLAAGCRMRLCKGAYKEPPEVAFPLKSDVDANYVKLMKLMLPSGIYHGIATHDPAMIDATKKFVAEQGIGLDKFDSKCSTASAPTCSSNSPAKAMACAFTFRLAQTGFRTSCAASPNGPRT